MVWEEVGRRGRERRGEGKEIGREEEEGLENNILQYTDLEVDTQSEDIYDEVKKNQKNI